MQSFFSVARLELIGLEFLHLDAWSRGYWYLLVLSDQVYPLTNKSAKPAADRLYNDLMLRYGLPGKILFTWLSSISVSNDSKPPLTTQRQTKRINQTILIMLRLYQSTVRHDGKTISTNYSPCMQLYKTLANWFFPLLSDVWSCSLLTYWFNFTNMLQHHFIAIKIELCWNLKRANARSLPTGF